ncbi:EAL domain-containing response regulator [Thermomonas sp.]|uniref:EAL domain-containing response regulator n=1 Tax=Thermomonas sp. TaxID=1971895 RepID=UPI002487AEF6|nr:EAL domain-containing response regulator [Thermomonas sp.]MDI1251970.1 EAL domain-containing response regulator [Thermomonas sp.]
MPTSTWDDNRSPNASAALPGKDLCFLVVEDHEFQRSMIVEMLENLGARLIYEAADGFSALEVLRELDQAFDVIITDIDMPGMDGMAFIRRLGEAKVRASLIITSGLDTSLLETVETMCGAYGMHLLGTVEKPPTPARFAQLIGLHWRTKPNADKSGQGPSTFSIDEVMAGLHADQFEPFYQPKIDLMTNRVKGAEALARWRHPHFGIVLPYAFISLLEDANQISELTWIILAKSARDCRSWRDAGFDLNVSVNLSVKMLEDPAIADAITWQVTHQGLDPKHMILEITESAAMNGVGQVLENLIRLRIKGFGLSIDDYGTGYSSMQQLTRIPFTELKIDQSFVKHATRQASSRKILESSLEMARKLGISSVAEGAETAEDWNLLRECGCDIAQGFFVAKPMKSVEFPEWVRAWA